MHAVANAKQRTAHLAVLGSHARIPQSSQHQVHEASYRGERARLKSHGQAERKEQEWPGEGEKVRNVEFNSGEAEMLRKTRQLFLQGFQKPGVD
jgi:hypothetical protein